MVARGVLALLLAGCSTIATAPPADSAAPSSPPSDMAVQLSDLHAAPALDLAPRDLQPMTAMTCDGPCCTADTHRCGDVCASNQNVNSCGPSSCSPCPTVANAAPVCIDEVCDFACNAGYHRCGDACIPESTCCSIIDCIPLQPLHGSTVCSSGRCIFFCDDGYVMAPGPSCVKITDMATLD